MVYVVDPLRDGRWPEFVGRHSSSSVFHTQPWLEAVRRTYGYTPVVYTTSPAGAPLANAIVFCQIRSWLTGRRMVSVPFADHCEPLTDRPDAAGEIARELRQSVEAGEWKYVELRPTSEMLGFDGAVPSPAYWLHTLDLRPSLEEILRRTHKSCVQRPIRRAEREGLVHESGSSERLLKAFYRLMVQTRRRHQLPPQPIEWFRNLVECMSERLQIRVAFRGGDPVASILTLTHGNVLVYKYGCSDADFQNLGGTPFLFWKAIVEAKAAGLTQMDFGRSDADNPGLIAFKERWGAQPSELKYLRWSRKRVAAIARRRSTGVVKQLFAVMPDAILQATGRLLYRHVG
jgi:hypothetical protein